MKKHMIRNFALWCKYIVVLLVLISCKKDNNPITFDDEINVSVKELKSFYKGEDVLLNKEDRFDKIFISGVVTSSSTFGNVPFNKGMMIQEDRDGIGVILEDKIAEINEGDSVTINVNTGTLASIDGNLVIQGVKTSDISVLKEKVNLLPRAVAVAELNANKTDYVGSLVQIVGAEIIGHQPNEIFEGDKSLDDGTGDILKLHTEETASFAKNKIPEFGTFTGLVVLSGSNSEIQLWMRSESDLEEYVPSPYPPGFPEVFDTELVKDAYAKANLDLNSGNWTFDGVTLVTKTDLRPINEDGTKGVQFNQKNADPLYLQMNFDVYRGASKVTVLHGSYGNDPQCTWRLEYSTNGGVSWNQIGENVVSDNKQSETAEFEMDIKGTVRFRINKLGLGDDNNGRLNIDDFTIYNN